jgi:hypothetical protein
MWIRICCVYACTHPLSCPHIPCGYASVACMHAHTHPIVLAYSMWTHILCGYASVACMHAHTHPIVPVYSMWIRKGLCGLYSCCPTHVPCRFSAIQERPHKKLSFLLSSSPQLDHSVRPYEGRNMLCVTKRSPYYRYTTAYPKER